MFSVFKDLIADVCEEIEMAKEVGLELEHFQIKVFTKEIEVIITTKDPLDCVEMAWRIIDKLRQMNYDPEVLILP